jgi:hypothetical protein
VNEDTDGDRAALKKEIKRLQEELAATRRGQAQHPPPLGLATSDGAVADAEADAAWDALPEGQEVSRAPLAARAQFFPRCCCALLHPSSPEVPAQPAALPHLCTILPPASRLGPGPACGARGRATSGGGGGERGGAAGG